MSMWVYNKVICNKDAKDNIINIDFWKSKNLSLNCFQLDVLEINNGMFQLRFETHGVEYYDKEIRYIISNYKDIRWLCIEEEFFEFGLYYWNGTEVTLDKNSMMFGSKGTLMSYLCSNEGLYTEWPHYSISICNNNLKIEDFDKIIFYEYNLSDVDIKLVKEICRKYLKNKNLEISIYTDDKENQEELYIDDVYSYNSFRVIVDSTDNNYNEKHICKIRDLKQELQEIINNYDSSYKILTNIN